MLYRDCTGKKVVPTIARGVTLGESDKSLTLHFRHGANSSTGQAALPGAGDFSEKNTDPNELFELQLSRRRLSDKNAVKKTGDRSPLFAVRDRRPAYRLIDRGSPGHIWAARQRYREPLRADFRSTYDTERLLPYSER
jgi:hypothetical protein